MCHKVYCVLLQYCGTPERGTAAACTMCKNAKSTTLTRTTMSHYRCIYTPCKWLLLFKSYQTAQICGCLKGEGHIEPVTYECTLSFPPFSPGQVFLTVGTNIPESISGHVHPSAGGGESVLFAAVIVSSSLLQLWPVSNGVWMEICAFLPLFVSLLLVKTHMYSIWSEILSCWSRPSNLSCWL